MQESRIAAEYGERVSAAAVYASTISCTYVSLLGLERAQEMVDAYTAAALDALTVFSGDTAFLHDFAVGLATRSK